MGKRLATYYVVCKIQNSDNTSTMEYLFRVDTYEYSRVDNLIRCYVAEHITIVGARTMEIQSITNLGPFRTPSMVDKQFTQEEVERAWNDCAILVTENVE